MGIASWLIITPEIENKKYDKIKTPKPVY